MSDPLKDLKEFYMSNNPRACMNADQLSPHNRALYLNEIDRCAGFWSDARAPETRPGENVGTRSFTVAGSSAVDHQARVAVTARKRRHSVSSISANPPGGSS